MDRIVPLLLAGLLGMPMSATAQNSQVTKTASTSVLSPGAFVEFTVVLENGDVPQAGVVVEDKLPEGLVIPDGTAPTASKGEYDPTTGIWFLGDMEVDEVQSLRIPAQVVADPLPTCIVNYARSYLAVTPLFTQHSDFAALRQPDSGACVVLQLSAAPREGFDCKRANQAIIEGEIRNVGTDFTTNVRIVLEDGPDVPPGMVFEPDLSACDAAGTVCTVVIIGAGSYRSFQLVSREAADNEVPVDYEITLTATSAETEDEPASITVAWTKPIPAECPELKVSSNVGDPCFIATAAFGSPMHPRVRRLREFRDEVLLPTRAGRAFVDYYYRYSPPVADLIAERPALRALTRAALWPFVWAVAHPLALFFALLALLFGLVGWRKLRPRSA